MYEEKRLSDLGIPHLGVVLVEIFQVPPPEIFPEVDQPTTVGELARASKKPVAVIWETLMNLRAKAHQIEIDVQALHQALAGDNPPLLLDVREPWEFEMAHIAGSLLLASLSFSELLPRLKAADAVVTICHHGIRSFSAAMYLKEQGIERVQSLAGGLEQWALSIDPAMARY